ncbi:MAG: hypothetical protein ABIU87_12820 [Ornithinibacter sp.]
MWRPAVAGLVGGLAWGVVARGFMRLLTNDPEFTWSGTLFIVGLATIAGLAVGTVHGARTSGRSAWWRLVGIPFLGIFLGAGMMLLPGAVGAALVIRGGRVLRIIGALIVLALPVSLVTTGDDRLHTALQFLGLLVLTGCVMALGGALFDLLRRWEPRPASAGDLVATPTAVLA